jgi:hypothetical protein
MPAEHASRLDSSVGAKTPAKFGVTSPASETPAKSSDPAFGQIVPPQSKRRWILKPSFGGPAPSGYSESEAALALERRGWIDVADDSHGCVFDQLGHQLASASQVVRDPEGTEQ